MPKPAQQAVLVAGGVAAKIALLNIFRQRGKGQLGAGERLLPGGHVAIAKLVRQHQVGFRPDRHHGLIAAAAFIVRLRRRFVTLDNRRVLVHRGDAQGGLLLGVELGDAPHHPGLHRLQSLHRRTAGHNETLLHRARGTGSFQGLIVKALEKTAHRTHLGKRETQAPFQAGVVAQQLHVLGAIAAGGLQQDDRFQVLRLVKPALALLELEMRRGQSGNAQRAEGAGGGQQPGVRTGHLVQGPRVDFKGRLLLGGDASRHGPI